MATSFKATKMCVRCALVISWVWREYYYYKKSQWAADSSHCRQNLFIKCRSNNYPFQTMKVTLTITSSQGAFAWVGLLWRSTIKHIDSGAPQNPDSGKGPLTILQVIMIIYTTFPETKSWHLTRVVKKYELTMTSNDYLVWAKFTIFSFFGCVTLKFWYCSCLSKSHNLSFLLYLTVPTAI